MAAAKPGLLQVGFERDRFVVGKSRLLVSLEFEVDMSETDPAHRRAWIQFHRTFVTVACFLVAMDANKRGAARNVDLRIVRIDCQDTFSALYGLFVASKFV